MTARHGRPRAALHLARRHPVRSPREAPRLGRGARRTTSIATGPNSREFPRTVSRLVEMQHARIHGAAARRRRRPPPAEPPPRSPDPSRSNHDRIPKETPVQKFKAYRTFQENDVVVEPLRRDGDRRARPGRRGRPDQVLDDQLQGRAVVQRRRQDHAQVSDHRRHRHGRHGRVVARPALEARRQGDRARLRHGRRARRRLRRVRARAGRLGGAAAREHDGVRRDDARHRGLHRGAGDHADGAQRPQAGQRPGRRHRRDRRRGLGRDRDPAPSSATTWSRSPARRRRPTT